jgi:putative pyruvate formate lyase activating enzyme
MSHFVEQLSSCRCCPRQCGVDRLAGQLGFCRTGGQALVAHLGLHYGEEPPISGSRGSGTVFFAGCNMCCVFCQNYQISQEFQSAAITPMTTSELAEAMLRLQADGAHNINFVSPSHMVWPMAEAILTARERGLTLPVVYNTNGYDSLSALRQIRGLIDIYLPDLKYLDNAMGREYSKVNDYANGIGEVLAEMLDQVGHLELDKDGIARRGLLVRHLVLPGGGENSRRCLRLLARLAPEITVSLMSQYSPQHNARSYPAINRPLSAVEYDAITDYAFELGLDNVFVQELTSQDEYLPDFNQDHPFDSQEPLPRLSRDNGLEPGLESRAGTLI